MENKKYNIIYADPPWTYPKRNNKNTKFGGGAMGHYPTLSFDDIYNLPIKNLADENCALLLWVTFPKLNKCMKTFEHWGFEYKTIAFNWVKTNKKNDKPFFGVGYYTKSNTEVCLLGVKGKMKPISNYVSSVVIEPRDIHSKKPSSIRDKIVQLFGDIPRVELFAREKTDGWDIWGNELENDID
jgi:N6-adenosine-specific RNA methylase IME4